MADENQGNLPETFAAGIAGIPKMLVPASLKALDRLVGAAIDLPVAWLNQQKAKIDAQTNAFTLVETAIGEAAASLAEADSETVERAAKVLIRKSYRKQINREAVAAAMVEDLASAGQPSPDSAPEPKAIDEDWLNVFERYAEDASTERMQKLWGRVLAGEVRKPGRFSMRTLRFLSEFSQADALTFADFATSAFGDVAPNTLVKPDDDADIRELIYLEASGLIQGASGLGLNFGITINDQGNAFLKEGRLAIMFKGKAGQKISSPVCALTPLGQELLALIPGRDAREAARKVGRAVRTSEITAAYVCAIAEDGKVSPVEVLWQENVEIVQTS